MSTQLSSTITSLQKEGISVAGSAKANAQRVGAELIERFGEQPGLDFVALQLALGGLVEDDLGLLLKTDDTHVHEVVGSRLQLRERNASFEQVFATLSGIRGAIGGVYGDAARVGLFGDVSALPQDPLELHRLGVRVHEQLTGDGFQLPPRKLAGFPPVDTEALAEGLKRELDRFADALATLNLERKDADVTLFDKNQGVGEFKRTVRFAAGCLASLYGLAGFDDLAAKIRPRRRAARRASAGDPEGGVGPSTGSDAAGNDAAGTDAADSGESAESESSEPSGEDSGDPARGEAPGPIGIVR